MQPEALPPKERALLDAARSNDLAKVKDMLSQGAVVDARDNLEMPWGQTALMYAAQNGNEEMVNILIYHGAVITAKDEAPTGEGGGQQPLHYAMRSGGVATAKVILSVAEKLGTRIIDRVDKFGETPLNVAIANGNDKAIRFLLQHGLDLKKTSRSKKTAPPLYVAALYDQPAIFELLLASGADANATNEAGQTPLNYAVSKKSESSLRMVELLLNAGADVELPDNSDETPLLNALLCKNSTAIKMLSKAGANINRVNEKRNGTLLDVAEQRVSKALAAIGKPTEPEWARQESKVDVVEWKVLRDLLLELGAKHRAELCNPNSPLA